MPTDAPPAPGAAHSAGDRVRRLVLIATILGSAVGFLDGTVVNVALPTIGRALHIGLTGQQWVGVSYTISLVALYLLAGGLGDRLGLARMFTYGCAGFAVASLVAGLAPDAGVLITMRVVQGAAAAFLTSSSLALLRVTWAEDAGRAIGLWTSGTSLATVFGPFAGGAIAQYVDWRLIFFINVPVAGAAVVMVRRSGVGAASPLDGLHVSGAGPASASAGAARPGHHRHRAGSTDLLGSILAAGWVGALSYWLVQGQQDGFARLWWAAAAAVLLFALFVLRQARAATPLLPLGLLRNRVFAVANLATLLIYAALGGAFFYLGLYLQSSAIGLGATVAGLATLPVSVAMITLAPRFGQLADRIGPRLPLTVGPLVMAGGTALWLPMQGHDPWPWLIPGVILFGVGLAILVAPITATALQAVPGEQAGVAAAVNTAISRLGGIVATAGMGAVATAAFAARTSPRHGGGHANPFSTAHAAPAVLSASHHAFALSMLVAIALTVAGALAAAIGLPSRPRLAPPAPDGAPDEPHQADQQGTPARPA